MQFQFQFSQRSVGWLCRITQLAETTVGVREISKQIGVLAQPQPSIVDGYPSHLNPVGRISVCSQGRALLKLENPQAVMIVSKVQDSTLVQLTKHLAVWLASTPKPGSKEAFTV